MSKVLYKFLGKGRVPCHGGEGRHSKIFWMPKVGVEPCFSGYHLCTEENLCRWVSEELWVAEGRGKFSECGDKVVFEEARLIRKLDWDAGKALDWAIECLDMALGTETMTEQLIKPLLPKFKHL